MISRTIFRARYVSFGLKNNLLRQFCKEGTKKDEQELKLPLNEDLGGFDQIKKIRRIRQERKENKSENAEPQIATLEDLKVLTKFQLSLLNTFVGLSGYLMYPSTNFLSIETALFCLATQLMAMTSQASNQIIERDYDKQMVRTCLRPIPKNKISVKNASILTIGLYLGSNAIFLSYFPPAAFLTANSILYSYLFVYTPLKRKTEMNTHFGSVVGALPPVLGWMAAGGSLIDPASLGLFTFLLAWQYPHFYGILWTYRNDYDKNGYKMLQDHIKAAKTMKICILLQAASCALLTYIDFFGITGMALLLPSFYKYSYIPIKNFEKDPSVENAKYIKKGAYYTFGIFFLFLLLQIAGLSPEKIFKHYNIEAKDLEENLKPTDKEEEEFQEMLKSKTKQLKLQDKITVPKFTQTKNNQANQFQYERL